MSRNVCMLVLSLLLAGCASSGDPAADTGFTAGAQCAMQCQASYRSCMATPKEIHDRSCEQQMAPQPDKRCKDIQHPELRRSCELKAHACQQSGVQIGCEERRSSCMSGCG
ncbi:MULTISPECIES: hypothetical protein [Stenotrophomonas]|uniref:hypothetical protein n=1 Tax=Stenotrophomonas TaxID=40323 RepID=UPI0013FD0756|nr:MULTISPECIES: hypothetical protein [Stenotrophomonas]